MAKTVHDTVLDAALNEIATATRMTICAGQPVSVADATAKMLANHTMVGGDYTNANGDTSGRKVTVAQQASITVDTTGTADHIGLDDATDLLYVTTCTAQALTAGNTVTVPAWDVEIADPT